MSQEDTILNTAPSASESTAVIATIFKVLRMIACWLQWS